VKLARGFCDAEKRSYIRSNVQFPACSACSVCSASNNTTIAAPVAKRRSVDSIMIRADWTDCERTLALEFSKRSRRKSSTWKDRDSTSCYFRKDGKEKKAFHVRRRDETFRIFSSSIVRRECATRVLQTRGARLISSRGFGGRGEKRAASFGRSIQRVAQVRDLFRNWSLSFTKLVGGRRAFSRRHDTL